MMGKVLESTLLTPRTTSPVAIEESIPLTKGAKSRIGYRFKVGRGEYKVAIFNVCPWCEKKL
jgi:hypothetical protein